MSNFLDNVHRLATIAEKLAVILFLLAATALTVAFAVYVWVEIIPKL